MDDLLEFLARKTGCLYLSDLLDTERLYPAIQNIPEEKYPLDEWNEMIAYIYRTDERFTSVAGIKRYIASLEDEDT